MPGCCYSLDTQILYDSDGAGATLPAPLYRDPPRYEAALFCHDPKNPAQVPNPGCFEYKVMHVDAKDVLERHLQAVAPHQQEGEYLGFRDACVDLTMVELPAGPAAAGADLGVEVVRRR
jgi:hypothetical protein